MKVRCARFFLLLAFTMINACSHDAPPEFNTYDNLLQEFRGVLREETESIDMTQNGNAGELLLQGWSFPEDTHIWGLGQGSRLQFYRYDVSNDIELELICWTLPDTIGQKQQKVEVFLNDTLSNSFLVQPGRDNQLTLHLPAAVLRSGLNILEFKYSYSVSIRAINPDSNDERELSVSFKKLQFSSQGAGALQFIEQQHLLQKSGTPCELLKELPAQFELGLEYQSLRRASSSIEFLDQEGNIVKTITLPTRRLEHKTLIRFPEPGLYKLRFLSRGDPESYTVWKQVQINYYQEQRVEGGEKDQGFTKSIKPDILLYVVDTLRADHVSAYGYARNTTPNFDRFARENTFFTHAYSASSWTRPSGATIMSGLLPKNHRTIERDDTLSEEIVTLAEVLQENGYYTAAFSANGNITSDFGFQQGFDQFKVFYPSHPITTHTPSNDVNDVVFAFLDTYILQEDRQPIFLLVWTVDPHGPYAPLEDVNTLFSIEQYERVESDDPQFIQKIRTGKLVLNASQKEFVETRYDQEVYFNDRSFGDFLEKTRSLSIYDDAFILFTSDHGEEFFEHGGVGHGMTLYNELIRIPLAVKSPQLQPGEYQQRAQLTDIYPSILDIIGISYPYRLDGCSWLASFPKMKERTLFFDTKFGGNDLVAILDDEKKLILNKRSSRPPANKAVPPFEAFALEDFAEEHMLELSGMKDDFRVQQIFSYSYRKSTVGVHQQKVNMTPELDRKLRDLGYVK